MVDRSRLKADLGRKGGDGLKETDLGRKGGDGLWQGFGEGR